jgi:very-short-patch-repair endonuclease
MANETARRLRKTMTRQEVKLWARLRALRSLGLHFRRQSPLGGYIVDFECRRARLVIELDGGQHGFEGYARRDRSRDATLHRSGYRVMRFWNHEVDHELEGVIEMIVRAVRAEPHPAAPADKVRGSGHPPLQGRD